METRTKLTQQIYSEEKKPEKSKPQSVKSVTYDLSKNSKGSNKSNSSMALAQSCRIGAVARKAKLEVEKQSLEQELEMQKMQLLKEILMAEAEEMQ